MIEFEKIQAAAQQIAKQFKPQKIILFGSYAYGKPNEHSDVDFMVLIRGRNVGAVMFDQRSSLNFPSMC